MGEGNFCSNKIENKVTFLKYHTKYDTIILPCTNQLTKRTLIISFYLIYFRSSFFQLYLYYIFYYISLFITTIITTIVLALYTVEFR